MKKPDLEQVRHTLEKLQEELFLAEQRRNQEKQVPNPKPNPTKRSLQTALERLKRAAKNMND